jgi:hypothetical protein
VIRQYAIFSEQYKATLGATIQRCENEAETIYVVSGSGGFVGEDVYFDAAGAELGRNEWDDMVLPGEEDPTLPRDLDDFTCRTTAQSGMPNTRTVCNDPRPEICTMQYDPVCGFREDGTSLTYGNECSACGDADVVEWEEGECAVERDYISYDPNECKTMLFLCVEGKRPFFDEDGCGCEPGAIEAEISCEESRPEACTKEYMPVCGRQVLNTGIEQSRTYGNKCTACSDMKVVGYTEGACEQPKLAATECNDPRPEVCTMDYNPVCGQREDWSKETYGNGCDACSDPDVVSHVPGECA